MREKLTLFCTYTIESNKQTNKTFMETYNGDLKQKKNFEK